MGKQYEQGSIGVPAKHAEPWRTKAGDFSCQSSYWPRLGPRVRQGPNTEELLGYSSFAWLTSTLTHTPPAPTINDQLASAYTHKDELKNVGGLLAFQTIKLGSCGRWKVNECWRQEVKRHSW
jgi:hypothetical protein